MCLKVESHNTRTRAHNTACISNKAFIVPKRCEPSRFAFGWSLLFGAIGDRARARPISSAGYTENPARPLLCLLTCYYYYYYYPKLPSSSSPSSSLALAVVIWRGCVSGTPDPTPIPPSVCTGDVCYGPCLFCTVYYLLYLLLLLPR